MVVVGSILIEEANLFRYDLNNRNIITYMMVVNFSPMEAANLFC